MSRGFEVDSGRIELLPVLTVLGSLLFAFLPEDDGWCEPFRAEEDGVAGRLFLPRPLQLLAAREISVERQNVSGVELDAEGRFEVDRAERSDVRFQCVALERCRHA